MYMSCMCMYVHVSVHVHVWAWRGRANDSVLALFTGFIFLQWPHQGARNFTKAAFLWPTFLWKFFPVSVTGSCALRLMSANVVAIAMGCRMM